MSDQKLVGWLVVNYTSWRAKGPREAGWVLQTDFAKLCDARVRLRDGNAGQNSLVELQLYALADGHITPSQVIQLDLSHVKSNGLALHALQRAWPAD